MSEQNWPVALAALGLFVILPTLTFILGVWVGGRT